MSVWTHGTNTLTRLEAELLLERFCLDTNGDRQEKRSEADIADDAAILLLLGMAYQKEQDGHAHCIATAGQLPLMSHPPPPATCMQLNVGAAIRNASFGTFFCSMCGCISQNGCRRVGYPSLMHTTRVFSGLPPCPSLM